MKAKIERRFNKTTGKSFYLVTPESPEKIKDWSKETCADAVVMGLSLVDDNTITMIEAGLAEFYVTSKTYNGKTQIAFNLPVMTQSKLDALNVVAMASVGLTQANAVALTVGLKQVEVASKVTDDSYDDEPKKSRRKKDDGQKVDGQGVTPTPEEIVEP
jgi:hypothetical protein